MEPASVSQIDFYYWANQCPHNGVLRDLLTTAARDGLCRVQRHDLAADGAAAASLRLFSPTLLIFDGRIRWNGPLSRKTLAAFARGEVPSRPPYRVRIGDREVQGRLVELTEDTVSYTGKPCGVEGSCCGGKSRWLKEVRTNYGLPHLGYLHLLDGECVGGAEFVPATAVPYPIPKDTGTAFLTCSYLSVEEADYRSHPLRRLEESLPHYGFSTLLAVASDDVVFPNGPLAWFTERGYTDLGEIHHEVGEGARMHLVRKAL